MQVVTAKSAGFCFGVRRAVEKCYEQARINGGSVYTYGPIIHNEMVVSDLEKHGVGVIRSKEELMNLKSGTVIIRSHGVSSDIYDLIDDKENHKLKELKEKEDFFVKHPSQFK